MACIEFEISEDAYNSGIVDLRGVEDKETGVIFISTALRQPDGMWQVIAVKNRKLVRMEVMIRIPELDN